MQKAESRLCCVIQGRPVAPRLFEQRVGALHVGMDECAGIDDGPIDVALSREVHDGARTMRLECGGDTFGIAYIGAHKLVALVFFE